MGARKPSFAGVVLYSLWTMTQFSLTPDLRMQLSRSYAFLTRGFLPTEITGF